jgi:hypothetical protein
MPHMSTQLLPGKNLKYFKIKYTSLVDFTIFVSESNN